MFKRVQRVLLAVLAGLGLVGALLFWLWPAQRGRAAGDILCVVPPGTSTGPYAACAEVWQSVQAAVDEAADGDEIWVAAGVYTDLHTVLPYMWTQVVIVTRSLTIRGGYTPPFTAAPDPEANPAVLDAQGQATTVLLLSPQVTLEGLHIRGGDPGGVFIIGGTVATLRQNVIYDNRGGGVLVARSTAFLEGNVVRDNVGDVAENVRRGGGVVAAESQLTLVGNTIRDNTAAISLTTPTQAAYGGGVWAGGSMVTLTHNLILSNTAVLSATTATVPSDLRQGYGGGVALVDSQGTVAGNEIRGNTAVVKGKRGTGGGLFIEGSEPLTINGNVIAGNVAVVACINCYEGTGGGATLFLEHNAEVTPTVTLAGNLIEGNTAVVSGTMAFGGGLFVVGDFFGPMATLHLVDNRLGNNRGAVSGDVAAGGAAFLAGVRATLSRNAVFSNTAVLSAHDIAVGGGLYATGSIVLSGDVIQHNTAAPSGSGYGGGISIGQGDVTLTNVALSDNWAPAGGGGLAIVGNQVRVDIWHTTIARNGGGGVLIADERVIGDTSQGYNSVAITNTILVSHSVGISITSGHTVTAEGLLWYGTSTPILAGITATVTINQAITGDPRLAPDGYHLLRGSAAIDRGVTAGVALDIDGEGRNVPPDLGADEFYSDRVYLPVMR